MNKPLTITLTNIANMCGRVEFDLSIVTEATYVLFKPLGHDSFITALGKILKVKE